MFTSTINRPKLQTAVLKWFLDEEYSFEQETALANCASALSPVGLLDIGIVLGAVQTGTVAAAAAGGSNAGNGTVALAGTPLVGGAKNGTYEAVAIAALEWEVYDPFGKLIGIAKDAVAFSNQIGFTITHGSTPFAAGDTFTFAVGVTGQKVVPLSPSASDGSQKAIGVGIRQTTVPSGSDAQIVVAERTAVLLADGLIWPSGITAAQQAVATDQLAALGLIVRSS